MKTTLRMAFGALAFSMTITAGCGGVGIILFERENGGPRRGMRSAPMQVFLVDCADSFQATGGTTVMGGQAGVLQTGCAYQGQPMPWNTLGEFHAAPMAARHWDTYIQRVTMKADREGCPGLAVRRAPPSQNQQGEAVGAWCVVL